MTSLKRRIMRETGAEYRGRKLILIFEPPDVITVREKGRRTGFSLTVGAIYQHAAQAEVEYRRNQRRRKKRGRA